MATGQADKRSNGQNPSDRAYVRRRNIAPHAIFRIRERLVTIEEVSRPEFEIANMLDAAVDRGITDGHTEAVSDNGEASLIVSLEPTFSELWALVRRNRWQGNQCAQVIVTVLTSRMVQANRVSGRWVASTADEATTARAVAKKEDVRIGTSLAPALAHVVPGPPAEAKSLIPVNVEKIGPLLVGFEDKGVMRYELVTASLVGDRVSALMHLGQHPKVYRQVQVRVRVEIEPADSHSGEAL